ncbi:hypothetical protein SDC9_187429 [bioreactor metagenome]|uniref:Uncharacterized protein n=1 Tax=bioreactor metagenome TaxID=1076179 RepID=A0A645HLH5_9ZZZZ
MVALGYHSGIDRLLVRLREVEPFDLYVQNLNAVIFRKGRYAVRNTGINIVSSGRILFVDDISLRKSAHGIFKRVVGDRVQTFLRYVYASQGLVK